MEPQQATSLPLSIPAWLGSKIGCRLLRWAVSDSVDLHTRRQRLERVSRWATPPILGVSYETATIGSVPGEWQRPRKLDDQAPVILYLHGGAYTVGSSAAQRPISARLAKAARAQVFSVDYRLAPEHPFPAAVEDAAAVYRALLESGVAPNRIVLAGDSAGGGLAMATLLSTGWLDIPPPAAVVLLCPWLDLTLSGNDRPGDAILNRSSLQQDARDYAGDDLRQALASPLFADFDQLPPILIEAASEDLLYEDALRFAESAQANGHPVQLRTGQDLWHDWQAFAGVVPEADDSIRTITDFIIEHTS